MARKSVSAYQNPLDWYLGTEDDADGLTFIAKRLVAEPLNEEAFRCQLEAKLRAFRYISSNGETTEKTFFEILTAAGALDELFRSETLAELWKGILLKKIVERSRERDKAVDGQELKKLRRTITQQWMDLNDLEKMLERNQAKGSADDLYHKINRDLRGNLHLLLISTKYKGSCAELLSGRPQKKTFRGPHDVDLAAKRVIYQVLRSRLGVSRKLSRIFICQLAELIVAESKDHTLSDGQSLYKYIRRSH